MRRYIFTALVCAMICPFASCGEKPAAAGSSEAVSAVSQSGTEAEPLTAEAETSAAETVQPVPDESVPDETTESPSEKAPADDTEPASEEALSGSEYVGKWECISVTIDGETYEGEYMGVPLYAMLAFEFSSAGTVKAISPMAGSETDAEWSADADGIVIGEDEEQLSASLSGDILHMTSADDSPSYDLCRVDEFTEFDYDEWFENYDYKAYSGEQS